MKQVSTSDNGNGNEGAKQSTSLTRFNVSDKGELETKIYANKSPYKFKRKQFVKYWY